MRANRGEKGWKGRAGDWQASLARRARASNSAELRDFYEAFPSDGEMPVGELPLVAIDLETSGLDPKRHAILSIGILPFTLGRIRLSERRHWVVRPRAGFSGETVVFHGITHTDTELAPEFQSVLPEILQAIRGRIPVVHYHPIEREFLDRAVRRSQGESFRFPVIDTMAIESRRYRHNWRSRLRAIMGRPPVSIRLNDSRIRYGLPPYEGHQAVLDALGTAELLQAQIAHHYSDSTPVGRLWV